MEASPQENEGPALLTQSRLTVLAVLDNSHTEDTDHEADSSRDDVDHGEAALGEEVERYDDADPLADVEEGVLDWVEDSEDHGEADYVVDGVASGGHQEALAHEFDVVRIEDEK